MSLQWVSKQNGASAPGAVLAGRDSGKDLYVIRASHCGAMIPGKLHQGMRHAHIAYDLKEHEKKQYEVSCLIFSILSNANILCIHEYFLQVLTTKTAGALDWKFARDGDIPPGAVIGGRDPNGDQYYIGRVTHAATVTVGKIHTQHKSCYVPYGNFYFRIINVYKHVV